MHLDVDDHGFPVSAVITGANVHDSQAAILLEKETGKKIKYCYSLMDSAYDASSIRCYIKSKGRIPVIEPNPRRA